MSTASDKNRNTGSPHVNTEEIIKNARRRTRAASSRRRGLIGDSADTNYGVDGGLALQPIAEPVEEAAPQVEAQPVRTPKTEAVPEPAPAARAPFVLSMLAIIAAGIVGLLLLNTVINTNAYALQDLRDNQKALDASEQQLTDELAELSAPGNLAAAADQLGLVEASDVTYLRLPDGKELKMPRPGDN
ncbi:MAG TPA: hypothetical protein H9902_15020 [Candidatus Stackebrandtia faecavium]|nr:hypothetical protein [Candidatus Stackebrandtia faecavium]